MMEHLYIAKVRNIHTGTCYVKLGYSSNVIQRMKQLITHNIHFEYSEFQLFEHESKLIGYIHDERRVHNLFSRFRAGIRKNVMPDGNTECYDSLYRHDITTQLEKIGYHCIYDEAVEVMNPVNMFIWQ
ncbi:GIY-YIG nuclease family protein [Pectobacterium odoriferum]|uniref:GIY-YIG nuclease family protein n=1 Tax=Pectobacterium odoriferum TaxID=78398 RepID=UPI000CD196F5|nr:GIY-YIG nuclease family protein [Pectobacterium odoriferum]POE40248.1 hypothetical protein BV920_08810 [Pectobacterium odoriferum]